MAQLRRNYQSQSKGLQTTFRLVVFLIIAMLCLVGGFVYVKNNLPIDSTYPTVSPPDQRTYIPTARGEVIDHKYYSLSYLEEYELAEWTAYIMDRNMLNAPNVPREKFFAPDPTITTKSAVHSDYTNSGYTRGHLVPAGDMAFDTSAMRESFFMSNMSPQLRSFNNGVWKELEENVRDWTYKAETLYIMSGPILSAPIIKKIGKNKVSVPSSFYKILLDYTEPEKKAVGFIIPNQSSEVRLEDYMVTIDSIEKITGIDFFAHMLNDSEEKILESSIDKSLWKVSDARYQLRINKWNNE